MFDALKEKLLVLVITINMSIASPLPSLPLKTLLCVAVPLTTNYKWKNIWCIVYSRLIKWNLKGPVRYVPFTER